MNGGEPTVVLVHGAFADSASWAPVVAGLLQRGVRVLAPAVELRSGTADGEKLAAIVRGIDGPVLLVGHSWGGVVITEAASRTENVTGLAFVNAFALEEGEAPLELLGSFPPGPLGEALVPIQLPEADGSEATWLSVAPEKFPAVFAAGMPAEQAAVLGASQRPIMAAAFDEKAGPAAWKNLPTWFLVCTADQAINPEAQRAMARRSGSTTVEIDSPHLSALAHPQAVLTIIADALEGTRVRYSSTKETS